MGAGKGKSRGHNLSLPQLLTNDLNGTVSTENSRASSAIKHKMKEMLIHVRNIQRSSEDNITSTHVSTSNN